MSYLIALYVYYNGNNLSVFGIEKGARDEDLNNSGLKRSLDQADQNLLSKEVIDSIKDMEKKEMEAMQILNYNEMLKEAQRKSQIESYNLHKAGVVTNDVFSNTIDNMFDTYDTGEIPMDFFSELNGFKK